MAKEIEFYRKKLDNGLTVLFEKRKIPVVSVSSTVLFGAQYEPEKIKGISHFIEHLTFKGTKNRNVFQISNEVEGKGGILNAMTGEDFTCYWNKLPKKYFSIGADITRDLVLNPIFDKNALEMERRVILEEIKMYHDNPSSYAIHKIKETLYENPFGLPSLGKSDIISKISRETILRLFDSVYSTNNMVFSVVGDADLDSVIEEARKFPRKEKKVDFIPIKEKNFEIIEKRKGIDQAHVVFGFHMPKMTDKNRYSAELFDCILGEGMSSRLFQEVREKRGLCYTIRSNLDQSRDYSYELIYAGTQREKVDEVKKIVLKEIKKMGELKESDLIEAKERLIGLRELNNEKSDSTMFGLIQEEVGGNAEEYYKYEERVNSVKLKDVQDISKLKGYSFVALVPEK
jgi:predicted Zn-dependent peptidase